MSYSQPAQVVPPGATPYGSSSYVPYQPGQVPQPEYTYAPSYPLTIPSNPPQPVIMPPATSTPYYTPSTASRAAWNLVTAVQRKKTFFKNLSHNVEKFSSDVVSEASRALSPKKVTGFGAEQRFWALFHLPQYEGYLGEYPCVAITNTTLVPGYAYLSYSYWSFHAMVNNTPFSIMIPLSQVAALKRGRINRESYHMKQFPLVKTLADDVKPLSTTLSNSNTTRDVIQLFTTDQKVHQFYHIDSFEKVFKLAMATWKNARVSGRVPPQPQPNQPTHTQYQQYPPSTIPPPQMSPSGQQYHPSQYPPNQFPPNQQYPPQQAQVHAQPQQPPQQYTPSSEHYPTQEQPHQEQYTSPSQPSISSI